MGEWVNAVEKRCCWIEGRPRRDTQRTALLQVGQGQVLAQAGRQGKVRRLDALAGDVGTHLWRGRGGGWVGGWLGEWGGYSRQATHTRVHSTERKRERDVHTFCGPVVRVKVPANAAAAPPRNPLVSRSRRSTPVACCFLVVGVEDMRGRMYAWLRLRTVARRRRRRKDFIVLSGRGCGDAAPLAVVVCGA